MVIKGGDLNMLDGLIYPEEGDLIERAVPKRRREFIAGRIYAREALSELGQPPVPILTKSSRAPRWPNGFVGAISHTQMLCAAVVGRAAEFASIGIDIEADTPLDPGLVPLICLPTELCARDTIETAIGIDLPKLLFVAKEAFYKLYNPITDYFLDFSDVKVVVNPILNSFKAYLANEGVPSLLGRRCAGGRFGRYAGTLFALLWLPVD
jgi:4'-phosphopantetheinyl transferase EntD